MHTLYSHLPPKVIPGIGIFIKIKMVATAHELFCIIWII